MSAIDAVLQALGYRQAIDPTVTPPTAFSAEVATQAVEDVAQLRARGDALAAAAETYFADGCGCDLCRALVAWREVRA